jgi:hypothetical protein
MWHTGLFKVSTDGTRRIPSHRYLAPSPKAATTVNSWQAFRADNSVTGLARQAAILGLQRPARLDTSKPASCFPKSNHYCDSDLVSTKRHISWNWHSNKPIPVSQKHFLSNNEQLVHAESFWACIRNVPRSNLDKTTDYPEILWLSLVPPGKVGMVPQIR